MKDSFIHSHVFNHLLVCIASSHTMNDLKKYWNESKEIIKKLPRTKIKKLIRIKLDIEKNLH